MDTNIRRPNETTAERNARRKVEDKAFKLRGRLLWMSHDGKGNGRTYVRKLHGELK